MTDKHMQDNIYQIRVKHHATARRVDDGKSATGAIKLYCLECSGESKPKDCEINWCPLWRYRPGADDDERSPSVPSDETYAGMIDPERSEAARARFMAYRNGGQQLKSTLGEVEDD